MWRGQCFRKKLEEKRKILEEKFPIEKLGIDVMV